MFRLSFLYWVPFTALSSDEAPHKLFGSSDKFQQVPTIKTAGLNDGLNVTAGAGDPAILRLLLPS